MLLKYIPDNLEYLEINGKKINEVIIYDNNDD